jgi:hypothetical protein
MCLAIIPPLYYFADWRENKYFDNVWNVIFFASMVFVLVLVSKIIKKDKRKWVSVFNFVPLLFSGWFASQFIYELATFNAPDFDLENPSNLYVWLKYFTCAVLGVGFIIIEKVWKTQQN